MILSNVFLVGIIIRIEAKRLLSELNELLLDAEKSLFQFSTGWLWRSQKRRDLKSRKLYGENGDAHGEAVKKSNSEICALRHQFAPAQKWNVDETISRCFIPTDSEVNKYTMPGHEKEKRKLALIVSPSASRTRNNFLFI